MDPLGLDFKLCVTASNADKADAAPISEDLPAIQNIELAGAAALARAPIPAPTSIPTPVTQVATTTAANDAVYATERALLSRAMPALGTAGAFVTGMLYSPELGGGLEQITAPDGAVYSKYGDEVIWNAAGVDGSTWQTASPQEDMEYRTWLANGGDGSFEVWLNQGKPSRLARVYDPLPESGELMTLSESDRIVRQKTKEYLDEIDEKIQKGELSKKDVGPVVAGVIDRRTGEFFSSYNNRYGETPDPLHPILKPRIEEMQLGPQHPSSPGSHAEIIALNKALLARGDYVTEEQLSEFTMLPLWKKGSGNGRMKAGDPAPRCGNCAQISDGVRNLSGDAPPLLE